MYNNAYVLSRLVDALDKPNSLPEHPSKEKAKSQPCLPSRLPTTGFLQREAETLAPKAVIKSLRRSPSPQEDVPLSPRRDSTGSSSSDDDDEQRPPRRRTTSISSVLSSLSSAMSASSRPTHAKMSKPLKIEPYQIFSAVEKRDIMFLMEVRDRDFELLLRKNGDVTPLLHAMRIGHQDVAVTLLGAFSRYINHLQDDEMTLPRTKTRLKALRTNLKLAIDFGLQTAQSDLIASFLQTLIMSEGEKWVVAQVSSISGALREGTAGKPVVTAQSTVRRFATKQLGKAESIAALEDYVANATGDLIMMATWHCALDTIQGEPIPTFYFARDDRVFRAFVDRLDQHKAAITRTCTRRLRWQMRVLRTVMDGRNTNYRTKIDTLIEEFDEGPGV